MKKKYTTIGYISKRFKRTARFNRSTISFEGAKIGRILVSTKPKGWKMARWIWVRPK